MKITLVQAIVAFWMSLLVWVFVEYLFYRMQKRNKYVNSIGKSINTHIDKPIH